jgi:hypothetical protein
MNEVEKIVCKPTQWFLIRAAVMFLMFAVFAVLFFLDGSTGYRRKNEVFYLHEAFKEANDEFAKRNQDSGFTPEAWQKFAAEQIVALPADPALLPKGMAMPMPWPAILHDYDRMKPLQWNTLWREYTKARKMNEEAPEQPYDSRKIKEQWVVFWISLALAAAAAFILIRTLRRTITADAEALTDQRGRRVPFADLKVLDLRKWDTKGLGFIDFDGSAGKGRLRIDGLTYGGFKADDGEPAERLMQFIRARFSGEIIEYARVAAGSPPPEDGDSARGSA